MEGGEGWSRRRGRKRAVLRTSGSESIARSYYPSLPCTPSLRFRHRGEGETKQAIDAGNKGKSPSIAIVVFGKVYYFRFSMFALRVRKKKNTLQ